MALAVWTLVGLVFILGPMAVVRLRGRWARTLDDPSILLAAPPEGVTPAVAAHIDGAPMRQSFTAGLLDLASRGEIQFDAEGLRRDGAEVGIDIGGADLTDPRFALNRRQPAGEAEAWLLGRLQMAAAYPQHAPWDSNALMDLNLPMMLATGAATVGAVLNEATQTPDQEMSGAAKTQREGGLVPGLADPTQRIHVTARDARALPMPMLFGTFLDTYARRHGWLGSLPVFTRLRWHAFGVVAGILGIAMLSSGVSAFSDAKTGLGMGLLFGGIVAFLVAPWMIQPTHSGGAVRAQLAAYRRTLQLTFAQAATITDVVARSKLDWIATTDQAIAWAVALGLAPDVEALLARSNAGTDPPASLSPSGHHPREAAVPPAAMFAGILNIGVIGQTGPSFPAADAFLVVVTQPSGAQVEAPLATRLRGWLRELPRHVQIEDVTMAATVIATPFLAPITSLLPILGSHGDFLGGLVAFLAAVGAIAAMATRVPDDNRLEKATADPLPVRIWLVGPFIGAVGFVAGDSLDRMGLPGGDALVGVAFLVAMVAFVFARRLPVVSRGTRRLLVAPFVLLSSAFLAQVANDFTSAFAGTDLLGQLGALHNVGLVVELFGILGFAALIFYEMLVFAPRELADPGASTRAWAVRFAIFYVSLVIALFVGSSAPLVVA